MASRELTSAAGLLACELQGVDGRAHALASLTGERATVLLFTGVGCPTARAYEGRLRRLKADWESRGVRFVAINSNNPYLSPPDTLASMVERVADHPFDFPYLKDEDGRLARAFGAICTPHAFLLDAQGDVVYEGRIDDARVEGNAVTHDLHDAIGAVVEGRDVPEPHTNPFGCAIVW